MSASASLLFLSATQVGFAQDAAADATTEADFFTPLPVVLHATRLNQSVEQTPASVTVLDRRMIEASSASTIPELLRYVPGFQLSYRSGNSVSLSYHGIADEYSRRVEILVDGHAIFSQAFTGGVVWSSLPISLDDVERVEIVRGPNTASYGANAFMGSINIVTYSAAESSGTSVRLDIGTDNRLKTNVRHADQIGDFGYSLSAFYEENQGLPELNDDLRAAAFNLKGSWQVNAIDVIEFGLGYRDADEGVGGFFFYDRSFESHHEQFRWRRINAADDELQISFSHNRFSSRDVAPDLTDKSYRADRYDIELQQIQRFGDSFRFVVGAGYRYDAVDAPWYYQNWFFIPDKQESDHQWRLFSNAEWYLADDLTMNFGLMYENTDTFDDALSARIGLNYRVNDMHSLRANISRVSRTPSLYEQFATLLYIWEAGNLPDNVNDLPEQLDAYEIGYHGQFFERQLDVDLKLFYYDFDDRFLLFDDYGPELYSRLHRYKQRGFEAQVQYASDSNTLNLAYSYVDEELSDFAGFFYTAPQQTISLLYAHQFDNDWMGSVSLFYVDDVNWNISAGINDPVTWVDLKVAKTFRMEKGEVLMELTAKNLTDESDIYLRGLNGANRSERNFLASLKYSF